VSVSLCPYSMLLFVCLAEVINNQGLTESLLHLKNLGLMSDSGFNKSVVISHIDISNYML